MDQPEKKTPCLTGNLAERFRERLSRERLPISTTHVKRVLRGFAQIEESRMAFEVMNQVRRHGPTDSGPKFVLYILADYADAAKRVCWPSQQTLARDTAMGESTVRRHVKTLEREGWIEIHRMKNGHNRYRLTEKCCDPDKGDRSIRAVTTAQIERSPPLKLSGNPSIEPSKEPPTTHAQAHEQWEGGGFPCFPVSGSIRYASGDWYSIAAIAGVKEDINRVADGFRNLMADEGLEPDEYNIETRWRGYCEWVARGRKPKEHTKMRWKIQADVAERHLHASMETMEPSLEAARFFQFEQDRIDAMRTGDRVTPEAMNAILSENGFRPIRIRKAA